MSLLRRLGIETDTSPRPSCERPLARWLTHRSMPFSRSSIRTRMADLTLLNSKSSWNLTKDLLRSDICGDHEHLLRANHDHLNHDHLTEGGLLTKIHYAEKNWDLYINIIIQCLHFKVSCARSSLASFDAKCWRLTQIANFFKRKGCWAARRPLESLV